MNDNSSMTSAPGSSLLPDGTATITTVHLALIAILAILVVIGILWGIRLKHRRTHAAREVAEDNAAIADHRAAAPTPAPAVDTVTPPIAAAPSPAGDTTATGPAAEITTETPAAPGASIPVTMLKGLGPKVAARLAELGIDDAAQLAALDDAGAAALDAQLGAFSGRMARDRWIEQARLLTAGDKAGYEAMFGKL